jgi:hypothetical protein
MASSESSCLVALVSSLSTSTAKMLHICTHVTMTDFTSEKADLKCFIVAVLPRVCMWGEGVTTFSASLDLDIWAAVRRWHEGRETGHSFSYTFLFLKAEGLIDYYGWDWRLRTAAIAGLLFIPRVNVSEKPLWWWWCRLGITPVLSTRARWQSNQQRHLERVWGMD